MFKRICSFVFGLFIMSLGVAFSIRSNLGTTPISSIAYSLTLITNLNIGITTFVFNAALIFMQLLILRSKFESKRLLQFINCFVFSYFCDVSLHLVSSIPYENSWLIHILFMIFSIFLIAFGIFIYMPADIAPLPGEGCVEAISIVFPWRFSSIKIGFDALMVITSIILCGLFYKNWFAAVGFGTIISAFFVGFTLRQISNAYTKITGKTMY